MIASKNLLNIICTEAFEDNVILKPSHIHSGCPLCKGTGRHRYCLSGCDEDETGYETCPQCLGTGDSPNE